MHIAPAIAAKEGIEAEMELEMGAGDEITKKIRNFYSSWFLYICLCMLIFVFSIMLLL